VGVWVGNFDGRGNKNLSGAECAGPLLFDIINSLPELSNKIWFDPPEMLFEEVELCAITGYVGGPACPKKISSIRPTRARAMKICPYHQLIQVDSDGENEVCSYCWETGHHEQSILFYPPGVLQHIRDKGNIVEKLPPHKLNCPVNGGKQAIEILYPKNGMRVKQSRDFNGELQDLIFQAAHSHPDQLLYWYLDDEFLGITKEKHKLNTMTSSGRHILTVVDSHGNKTSCRFEAL
jgi:penicillin-binding protein 1C